MGFIRENIVKIVIFIIILVICIVVFSLFTGRVKTPTVYTYTNMENKLLNAAKKYTEDNPKALPKTDDEENEIKLDKLINSGYISELTASENENVKCTGYVKVIYKNKSNYYIPYLKCGKYYETKSLVDYILENEQVVTTGDGLYKQGELYIYRGEKPNNYVLLGDRLYRIVEINQNKEIRLVSNKKLNITLVWDDRYNIDKDDFLGINDFSKSRLKESFDDLIQNNSYNEDSEYNYFSEIEMEKIIPHDICIGKRSLSNDSIDYSQECQNKAASQYLGLLYVSDVARASIDPNCRTIYDSSCINYNYFSSMSSSFRTITGVADNSYQVYSIYDSVVSITRAENEFYPNIVVYLDDLSLIDNYANKDENGNIVRGNGSYQYPYVVR